MVGGCWQLRRPKSGQQTGRVRAPWNRHTGSTAECIGYMRLSLSTERVRAPNGRALAMAIAGTHLERDGARGLGHAHHQELSQAVAHLRRTTQGDCQIGALATLGPPGMHARPRIGIYLGLGHHGAAARSAHAAADGALRAEGLDAREGALAHGRRHDLDGLGGRRAHEALREPMGAWAGCKGAATAVSTPGAAALRPCMRTLGWAAPARDADTREAMAAIVTGGGLEERWAFLGAPRPLHGRRAGGSPGVETRAVTGSQTRRR